LPSLLSVKFNVTLQSIALACSLKL